MKTNPLLMMLLLFVVSGPKANAQGYVPLAVEGAHWIVQYDVMATPQPFDSLWEYHALGDTVVEEQTYLKVYRRELELNEAFSPPFNPATAYELIGLLRENPEERKVYATLLSELASPFSYCSVGEENLLFDFSLSVGDTASFCALPDPELMGFTIITNIYEQIHWGLETRGIEANYRLYIEGIGSEFGLFEAMFAPVKSQDNRYVVSTFLAYYCRESPCGYIVSTEALRETAAPMISPNPATTHTWLQWHENMLLSQAQIELYSPTGKLLYKAQPASHFHKIETAHLPAGLYLIRLWDGERWVTEKLVVR